MTTIAYSVIGDGFKMHILCSDLNKTSVTVIPQAQRISQKRVWERAEEPEKVVPYCGMLSSGLTQTLYPLILNSCDHLYKTCIK